MLRPTPGDPWGVEQHHWNTGAEENQQLNPVGPSNRQKSSGPNQLKHADLTALTSGLGLDALSLALPALVELVVFINSGSQWIQV